MIRRLFCALIALVMLMGSAVALDYESELIRLHVVAADDTEEMQALKLEMRDVCLKCAEVCVCGAADADEAYRRLNARLHDFESVCNARARELSFNGRIAVETGVFDFPDRAYGKLRVPAGRYRALRVTIGEGKGHTGWCVLYPSLCKLNEADAGGVPDVRAALRWIRERLGWKS